MLPGDGYPCTDTCETALSRRPPSCIRRSLTVNILDLVQQAANYKQK